MPARERRRETRQNLLLVRPAAVVLVLPVTALAVVGASVIATRA